jgi:hypothetical protein
MKHTVHLKFPRLWGKKKGSDGTEVITEVDLKDKESDISAAVLVAAPLIIGVSIGYLVGFRAGVHKGGTNVIMMKD